jgi:MYXO-CTERM domain-containing protein
MGTTQFGKAVASAGDLNGDGFADVGAPYVSNGESGEGRAYVFLPDADRDGHPSVLVGGDDCDDTDMSIRPGAPDAMCNGVDNDCDGTPDDDYAAQPTTCGVGACAATGVTSCVAGTIGDLCTPATPAANDVSCDGVDDDCDGAADEDGACDLVDAPSGCGCSGTEAPAPSVLVVVALMWIGRKRRHPRASMRALVD